MNVKSPFLLPLFLFSLIGLHPAAAQEYIDTEDPQVNSQWQSNIATSRITLVRLIDEYIIFSFDYITARKLNDGWISMSSSTTISAAGRSQKIIAWGYIDNDGEFTPLDLDDKYSLRRDTRYNFVMAFPRPKAGVTRISINENAGSNGFFWNGIHINNPRGTYSPSSSGSSSSGSSYSSSPSSSYSDSRSSHSGSGFEATGSGTCFAVTSSGIVATCYHVVEEGSQFQIRGINGNYEKTYSAKVLLSDRANDLALLQIDDPQFHTLGAIPYSISSNVASVGSDVFVLGFPLRAIMGDEIKLTNGIISSRTGFQGDATSYQLSAAVQRGNSGGPLFDKEGHVIGVVNARLPVESASYAVKSPYLLTLISSLNNNVTLPAGTSLAQLTLAQQTDRIRHFVYIIEVGE